MGPRRRRRELCRAYAIAHPITHAWPDDAVTYTRPIAITYACSDTVAYPTTDSDTHTRPIAIADTWTDAVTHTRLINSNADHSSRHSGTNGDS